MLVAGTTLGRYTIRQPLGAGGMGEVYLAYDPELERQVALKVLPAELSADASRLARFVREAKAASALNHPNIVTVHDAGTHDDIRFLVTEHVDGQTLREWLEEGRPDLGQVLDVIVQAASALAAAHAAGIVHRDIKPENLMRRRDGLVKVLDFGIAKLAPSPAAGLDTGASTARQATQFGTVLGTVHYMSPEQASGDDVDARSDVWSLGVSLYELVAGQPPFSGPSAITTLAAILEREPEPLARLAPQAPASLWRVIERALCKRRDERTGSAAELAAELRAVVRELESAASESEAVTARLGPVPGLESVPMSNLPDELTPIVGRAKEVEEVTRLLGASGGRLLTLTGPGGTGKTRLAFEVARELASSFRDGVVAVDLSALADPALVVSAVGQALGVREAPGTPMSTQLAGHLRDRAMLLVLDNFEHLLAAAPLVSELLSAAPELKVLATSRAPLHLRHELEYAVEPLEVPTFANLPVLDEIGRAGAVALFVERARDVKPSFELTADNVRAVVEVCRRLEGLPLAIELAAARVKLFGPAALLGKLDHRLKVLTGGARDLPGRQQTMRGAVAWSYDLLDESERELVCRLAVFAGGCDYEAADAVCGAAGLDVLDGVASLVDKSLLRQREQPDGEVRFTMLEVVREYALEQLEASGEAGAARLAHARYFLQLAQKAESEIKGRQQAEWLARLEAEHDNLRAALGCLLEQDADACLRLATAMRDLWRMHGPFADGRRWLDATLERSPASPAAVRARAFSGAGSLARQQGDLEAARGYYEESLRIGRETDDTHQIGLACFSLGTVALHQGDLPTARAYLEESLARSRDVQSDLLIGAAINALGEIARLEGASSEARELYEQALDVCRQAGLQAGMSIALSNLGAIANEAGDLAGAGSAYRESLLIEQELGSRDGIGYCLEGLGVVAAGRGAWTRAARLGGAAEELRDAVGAPLQPLEQRIHESWVQRLRSELDPAEFDRAWACGRSMGLDAAVAEALESD